MKVVFLVGPTASGKSDLALELAARFGGVILNADSVQVYSELQIGSAAPSEADRARVPHELFQIIPPPGRITAGDYSKLALERLAALDGRVPVAFVVGGTGFYLMALEKGMLPIEKADPESRRALERELAAEGGQMKLHEELRRADPRAAARISPADHYRLVRAIEIVRRTGKPLTGIEDEHRREARPFPYPLLKLGVLVGRDELRGRVERRTRKMIESGLLGEVEGLVARGFADWEPLQSVGYRETLEFLAVDPASRSERDWAENISRATMRLAKKQMTWFRRDAGIRWLEPTDRDGWSAAVGSFLGEAGEAIDLARAVKGE